MAKDGTVRGGARLGAGRPSAPTYEKILDGKPASVVVLPTADLDVEDNLQGEDMPKVADYMRDTQHSGYALHAEEIMKETWRWLKKRACDHLITEQQVNMYAMACGRWIQAERALSEYGFLAKHPTTGNPIPSPFVAMSEKFSKQATAAWYQIYSTVERNCLQDYSGPAPHEALMASLLSD